MSNIQTNNGTIIIVITVKKVELLNPYVVNRLNCSWKFKPWIFDVPFARKYPKAPKCQKNWTRTFIKNTKSLSVQPGLFCLVNHTYCKKAMLYYLIYLFKLSKNTKCLHHKFDTNFTLTRLRPFLFLWQTLSIPIWYVSF